MSIVSAGGSAVSYGSYAGPGPAYTPAVRLDYGRSPMSPGMQQRPAAAGAPLEAVVGIAAHPSGPVAVPMPADDRQSRGSITSTVAMPMPTTPAPRRRGCIACPCAGLSCRDSARIVASIISGVLKGIVLAIVLVPMHTFGCIAINAMCLISWIDAGYYTLRFTKAVGFNLKVLLAVLLPFAVLLYFVVSVLAALLGGLLFSLTYPAIDTMNVKIQTAWRYAYVTASWFATYQRGVKNVMAYHGFATAYVQELLKKYRNPRYTGPVADIHPWDTSLGIAVGILSGIAMAAACTLLMCLKALPIMGRAVANHIQGRSLWFRGGVVMPLAWTGYFLLVPVAIAVAIPAAALYGAYVGVMAGVEVAQGHGALLPAGLKLREGWGKINGETTRYILHYDVPFLVIPSSTPVSIVWIMAGFIPLLLGIVPVVLLETGIVLISYVSALWAAYSKLVAVLFFTFKGGRYHVQAAVIFLMLILPVVVFLALFAYMIASVLGFASAVAVTHSKRSVVAGLQFIPATIYKFEYAVNKFCYAITEDEQVHWASFFPCFIEYARGYMPPKEFEEPVDTSVVAIVGKPARFMPKGMRRPQRDANGKLIDLTGVEGHIVPGKGILIAGVDGQPDRMIPFGEDGILPPGLDIAPHVLPPEAVYPNGGAEYGSGGGGDAGDAATEVGGHTVVTVASRYSGPIAGSVVVPQVPVVRRPMCLCCAAELDDEETDVYDPRAEPPPDAAAGAPTDQAPVPPPVHMEASSMSAGPGGDAAAAGDDGDITPPAYSPSVPPATPYAAAPLPMIPGAAAAQRAPAPLYVSEEDDAVEPPPVPAPLPPRPPVTSGSMSGLAAAAAKRAAAMALRERRGFSETVLVDSHPPSRSDDASHVTSATPSLSVPAPVLEAQPISSARAVAAVPPATPVRPPPHAASAIHAAAPLQQHDDVQPVVVAGPPPPLATSLPVSVTALTSPVHIQANAALARAQAAMQQASLATAASRARMTAPPSTKAGEVHDLDTSTDTARASAPASPARAAVNSRSSSAMPSPAGAAAMPRAPVPGSDAQHAHTDKFAASVAAHVPDDPGDTPIVDIESPAPPQSRSVVRSAVRMDAAGRDEFVLQPIVHPELPDVWARVPAPDGGDVYYVNYARGQSSWKLPPVAGK